MLAGAFSTEKRPSHMCACVHTHELLHLPSLDRTEAAACDAPCGALCSGAAAVDARLALGRSSSSRRAPGTWTRPSRAACWTTCCS